jgi:TetR/AcrR family transcriptional regulator
LRGRHDKSTQQQRLLTAIVAVSCEHGYEHATIARVIGHAGVSRPTFYEYFPRKETCFLAALDEIQRDMLDAVRRGVDEQPPQNAAAAVIAALVSFAQERPAEARFVMNETMVAARPALDARDRGVAKIARLVEDAYRRVRFGAPVPALPSEIIVGAVYRLLALCLVRGERVPTALQEDLLGWVTAYEQPVAQRRWRTLAPVPAPASSLSLVQAQALRAPPALAPGRPRRSAPEVSENHRLRIILATAEIVRRDGYAATTVAEITRAAGVDGRVFYRLFADKRDAFAAVRELAFQNALAVTAGAFFAVGDWPRRVWEAGTTFTRYLEQNPALTHACVVESHAGGPETTERLQDLIVGFTLFLQEGYQHLAHQRSPPSRLALEAVAQANFEILYGQARDSSGPDMAGLLTHLAYVSLAPFVGATKASELIAQMLCE